MAAILPVTLRHQRAVLLLGVVLFLSAFGSACKDGVNIFSLEDDIELGRQLETEIANNPQEYPVLDRSQYGEAYDRLFAIRDAILQSGEVQYRDEFEWNTYIIQDDETLNAFAAPGGYIYVYTGLMKFLSAEYELAGVMGHEIAHADLRHSTEQLTKQYGIQTLLGLVVGDDPGLLTQVAVGLASLKFSRGDETEADEASVRYLCPTEYQANGAAGFFQKLEDEQEGAQPPQFLSTHPSPENRVEKINAQADNSNCGASQTFPDRYQELLDALP